MRFGREKLKVVKELEPASLEHLVPSIILQPLVENAIKHGLADKLEGGTIYIRSRTADNRIIIEVEDDGVGMPVTGTSSSSGTGIGMVNVSERLSVVYGDAADITIESQPAHGTLVRLMLPVLLAEEMGGSVAGALYEARSSTSR